MRLPVCSCTLEATATCATTPCRSDESSLPGERQRVAQGVELADITADGTGQPANGSLARPSSTGSVPSVAALSSATGGASKALPRLLQGASKAMRALCKLSMRTSNVPGDASVTRGRILAMELIAVVLINHQSQFRVYPQLMHIVKGELGNCLLANCKSSSSVLQRLTCEVFVFVLKAFREEIKAKVCPLHTNLPPPASAAAHPPSTLTPPARNTSACSIITMLSESQRHGRQVPSGIPLAVFVTHTHTQHVNEASASRSHDGVHIRDVTGCKGRSCCRVNAVCVAPRRMGMHEKKACQRERV